MNKNEIFETLQYQYNHTITSCNTPGVTFDEWLESETDLSDLVAQWRELGDTKPELAQFLAERGY